MAEPLVYPVHSRDVWKVWPKAIWHIGRALLHSRVWSLDALEDWLEDARAQLIVYGSPRDVVTGYPVHVRAAMVTQFPDHGKTLLIYAFGADSLAETLPFLDTIERLGKRKGAEQIELCAPPTRRGWLRLLKTRGYAPHRQEAEGMILRKSL